MTFTCPMHREVRQEGPGKCPKCGMPLVPVDNKRSASQWSSNPLAMCLNPKVLAGLAVLAAVSMAAMMWGMRRSSGSRTPASSTLGSEARMAELRAELVRMKTERTQLPAELDAAQSAPVLPVNTQEGLGQKAEQASAPPV